MKNVSIGKRLAAGFAIVVALFVGVLAVIEVQLSSIARNARQIDDEALPYVLVVSEMDTARVEVQQLLTDVSATHNKDGFKEAEADAKRFRDGADKFKQLFRAKKDAENLKAMEAIEADFSRYYDNGKLMADTYLAKGWMPEIRSWKASTRIARRWRPT